MRTLILILSLLFPVVAVSATMQAQDHEGTTVTIMNTVCTNEVALGKLPALNAALVGAGAPIIERMMSAVVQYKGVIYGACWAPVNGVVLVIDESAIESVFPVPMGDFRPLDSV